MADFNTGKVKLDFRDAHRKPIKDKVRVTFENFHVKSFNFRKDLDKFPKTLEGVPAFPTGLWRVFVQPERYRPKSFFVNVPSGDTAVCEQFFFLHSDRARPEFLSPDDLFLQAKWKSLADLLNSSQLDGRKGKALYAELITNQPLLAAGLLNLHARTRAVTLKSGKTALSHLTSVVSFLQDRIYALAKTELHGDVLDSVQDNIILPADGSLHKFPIPGVFKMLTENASFKTPEKAGNLQLTFARNAQGAIAVDADVDEAKGIEHAFEVIGHKFTGGRTHPYDIHQILTFFYPKLPLGYDVVPA